MVRQSSIKGAMKSEPKSSGGCFPKCIIVIIVFIVVYLLGFVVHPVDDDNLRSGQASLPIEKTSGSPWGDAPKGSSDSVEKPEGEDDDRADAEEYEEELVAEMLSETVENELEDIKDAEAIEMDKDETALNQAAEEISNSLNQDATKLLHADDIDDQKIESWTSLLDAKVQETIAEEIRHFESDAEDVAEQTKAQIRDTVDEDFVEGFDSLQIAEDLDATESKVIDDMKSEIHEKAHYYQKDIQAQALQIEKDILEEKLSAQYGHAVTLVIVHDELEYADGGPDGGGNQTEGGSGNQTESEIQFDFVQIDDDDQADIEQRQQDTQSSEANDVHSGGGTGMTYDADDVYGDDDTGIYDDDDIV